MPPRKKLNSSSSSSSSSSFASASAVPSSSSKKSNPSNQPQASKFGIQHFFERHTQNALVASQNPTNDASNSGPDANPINDPQNIPVLRVTDTNRKVSAHPNPKTGSGSQANEPKGASQNTPSDKIAVVGFDADENPSEMSPEVSKSVSLKRFNFSPGMLIKQSQDDGGDEVTWKISPVNERLQAVSKRIPEMMRALAESSRLNALHFAYAQKIRLLLVRLVRLVRLRSGFLHQQKRLQKNPWCPPIGLA